LRLPVKRPRLGQLCSIRSHTRVTKREKTGAGGARTIRDQSLLGDIGANIAGLHSGMGFFLWLRDGWLHQLEGYAYGEGTRDIDFVTAMYDSVEPRRTVFLGQGPLSGD